MLVHLAEETITGFRQKFPLGAMPRHVFICINVGLYIFCLLILYLSIMEKSYAVPLAWILGVSIFINGAGHLGFVMIRGTYFPGVFTASLLIFASLHLMITLK